MLGVPHPAELRWFARLELTISSRNLLILVVRWPDPPYFQPQKGPFDVEHKTAVNCLRNRYQHQSRCDCLGCRKRWSVQLVDDVAVLRVSKNTEHKFVTATITSLQKAGTEKFALRVLDPNDKTAINRSAYSISITDGVAEITATADLPQKVLVSLISQLNDTGITRIKFAATKNSDGAPASQR